MRGLRETRKKGQSRGLIKNKFLKLRKKKKELRIF